MAKFMYRGQIPITLCDGTAIKHGDLVEDTHQAVKEGWANFYPVGGGDPAPAKPEEAASVEPEADSSADADDYETL